MEQRRPANMVGTEYPQTILKTQSWGRGRERGWSTAMEKSSTGVESESKWTLVSAEWQQKKLRKRVPKGDITKEKACHKRRTKMWILQTAHFAA